MPQARPHEAPSRTTTTVKRTAAAIGAGALAAPLGWMAYSSWGVSHAVPLPPALDAERRVFRSPGAGRLSYYASDRGSGRPVVLLHGVNAAASAAEVRPIFTALAGRRPVYALDLPGFGFSERADRAYSPALFARAIADFLSIELGEDQACDLVALSLSSEFAARVAVERPGLVHSIALVSPTGFEDGTRAESAARGGEAILRAMAIGPWAQPVFDLLASRPGIARQLGRSFAGPVDDALAEYAWRTAHQPGARHAPLCFLGGALFTPGARAELYDRVRQPVLVLYDTDPHVSFEALADTVARRRNWRALRIAGTRGLPQFDRPAETMRALDVFWMTQHDPSAPYRRAGMATGD